MHLKQVCIFPQKFPALDQIDYEETEHFQVYRSFMLNPDKFLQDV